MTEAKRPGPRPPRRRQPGIQRQSSKPEVVRGFAETQQLIGGLKRRVLSVRLDEALVEAAKARTGITSDTELAEFALASVALGDDYGEWLLSQAGGLDPSFELDL